MIFQRMLAGGGMAMVFAAALSAQPAAKPGYLTGRAVNSAGQPLAGVRIRVVGTTDTGIRSALDTRTKADGTYSLRLPAGQFSLRSANWDVKHAGRPYSLPLYLEGENNDDFDSTEGSVAKLTLRMSGKTSARKADDDEMAYFGGTLEVEYVTSDGGTVIGYPTGVQLNVDLTPQGPLFDGTAAQPRHYVRDVAGMHAKRFILDVPLATYVAKATFVTAGARTPALVGGRQSAARPDAPRFASSAVVEFPPRSGDAPLLAYGGVDKFVLRVVLPATLPTGGSPTADAGNGADATPGPDTTAPGKNGTPPAPANGVDSGWKVGDHANVLRSPTFGQWHPGTILKIKDGQYLIKFDAFSAEHNEWVDASRLKRLDADDAAIDTTVANEQTRANPIPSAASAPWKVGDAVNVLRSPYLGQWHTGKILDVKRDHYLIQYDNFGPEQNEWVDATRVKARE
jgi:hypothetical protein